MPANGKMSASENDLAAYTLVVPHVDFSLTDGTDIPAPPDSPTNRSTNSLPRPPTPGGGPLTSHPATPDEDPSPLTLDRQRTNTIHSSAAASSPQPTERSRRPSGVRRLLSLSSLRSSFSSSRTTLAQQQSTPNAQSHAEASPDRPWTPSITSSQASNSPGAQLSTPPLRQKRSSSWFKRKSGLFIMNGDTLEAVNERPEARDGKRHRLDSESTAYLPDVSALKGGNLNDGLIGWDEQLFVR